jgi:hypothetical protein
VTDAYWTVRAEWIRRPHHDGFDYRYALNVVVESYAAHYATFDMRRGWDANWTASHLALGLPMERHAMLERRLEILARRRAIVRLRRLDIALLHHHWRPEDQMLRPLAQSDLSQSGRIARTKKALRRASRFADAEMKRLAR